MPRLADTQALIRAAVVDGDFAGTAAFLTGGRAPVARLRIHERHYAASLSKALLARYPALARLIGQTSFVNAAQDYVRRHPPASPCIAEYGLEFPRFLASRRWQGRTALVLALGELEWHLGRVAIAISHSALGREALATIPGGELPEIRLELQPGLAYLGAAFPVDDIIRLHLAGKPPCGCLLEPTPIWLEVHGARGEFRMVRLPAATWTFRRELQLGSRLGRAAEAGMDAKADFDPGQALLGVFADGLAVAVHCSERGI
ncbi:MAG: putative DNA-binding domain-containing protein [Methylobacteriaceae bacterium]|nr:putative DNA-binding domain-containing protein [Methylobacteriaceae bacterium]MBV9703448.1 putative DNA-binding domain-containing protein [Methylobacteriaceae bacterium]